MSTDANVEYLAAQARMEEQAAAEAAAKAPKPYSPEHVIMWHKKNTDHRRDLSKEQKQAMYDAEFERDPIKFPPRGGGRRMRYKTNRRRGKTNRRRVKTNRRRSHRRKH